MYACSPDWDGGYITRSGDGTIYAGVAEEVCRLLRAGGCRSVHIGGGEPFLDFEGLIALVKIIVKAGIAIDYVETNAFWAADRRKTVQNLKTLARAGADTLCISLDPFHAEYVPLEMPLALAEACREAGFGYFLWQDRFLRAMSKLDRSRAHSRGEMEKLISPDYIMETARSYGIRFGGRAVAIEAEYSGRRPAEEVAEEKPCGGLLSGGNFHVDLRGRYIPPGCAGFVIPLDDIFHGFPHGKYPVFETLLTGGSAALLRYAMRLGFAPDRNGYPSGCALCFHIRRWICENAHSLFSELEPAFYTESLKWQ
jgi:hypothetical protein